MGNLLRTMSCGGEQAPPMMAPVVKEYVDLFDLVEPSQIECLNVKDEHPWQAMLKAGDDDRFCESNVDEQLLLNIGFREKVKIKSIVFKGAPDKEDEFPRDVKLFVNKRLGFGDVESGKPDQLLDLEPEDVADGKVIDLNFVRFQNVTGLSIFVERNNGGADTTIINRIKIIGCPIQGTNMSDLKKVG